MDFLVAAGIGLLILGLLLKIKEHIQSWRHEKYFDDTYRRWRKEEIANQRSSREKMDLSNDQKRRLKWVDWQFLHSQGFRLLEYHKACERVYIE